MVGRQQKALTPKLTYSISLGGQELNTFAQVYSRQCSFRHYAEKLLYYTSRQGFFTLSDAWLASKWEVSASTARRVIKKLADLSLVRIFSKVRTRDKRNPKGWYYQRVIVFNADTVKVQYASPAAQRAFENFERDILIHEAQPHVQQAVEAMPSQDRELRGNVAREFKKPDVTEQELKTAEQSVAAAPSKDMVRAIFNRGAHHIALMLKLACHLEHHDKWQTLPKNAAYWLIELASEYKERLELNSFLIPYMDRLAELDRIAAEDKYKNYDHETQQLILAARMAAGVC